MNLLKIMHFRVTSKRNSFPDVLSVEALATTNPNVASRVRPMQKHEDVPNSKMSSRKILLLMLMLKSMTCLRFFSILPISEK